MSIFGKLIPSLMIGTGLGVGPYGIAVAAGGSPSSAEITAEQEEHGFGEDCLLDEELCAILKDETWEPDEEEPPKPGSPQASYADDDLLEPRWDDFCSWGFEIEEFNTLPYCKPEKKSTSSTPAPKP